jgi:hypothetical protein
VTTLVEPPRPEARDDSFQRPEHAYQALVARRINRPPNRSGTGNRQPAVRRASTVSRSSDIPHDRDGWVRRYRGRLQYLKEGINTLLHGEKILTWPYPVCPERVGYADAKLRRPSAVRPQPQVRPGSVRRPVCTHATGSPGRPARRS